MQTLQSRSNFLQETTEKQHNQKGKKDRGDQLAQTMPNQPHALIIDWNMDSAMSVAGGNETHH